MNLDPKPWSKINRTPTKQLFRESLEYFNFTTKTSADFADERRFFKETARQSVEICVICG